MSFIIIPTLSITYWFFRFSRSETTIYVKFDKLQTNKTSQLVIKRLLETGIKYPLPYFLQKTIKILLLDKNIM